ncbi:hypothetical protein OJ998_14700 [Solirubrobacter taibaiensis]|nr:hypothetical protein [Solirubrobacter taibaiensis]
MRRLLILTVLLAGCGASEQQHVQQALRDFYAGWEHKDYAGTCARMTTEGRRQFASFGGKRNPADCPDALRIMDEAAEEYSEPGEGEEAELLFVDLEELEDARIRINGATAIRYRGSYAVERLRKVDGRWLVDANA